MNKSEASASSRRRMSANLHAEESSAGDIAAWFWLAVNEFDEGNPQPLIDVVAKHPIVDPFQRKVLASILAGRYRCDQRKKLPTAELAMAFAHEAAKRVNGRPTNDEICLRIAPDRDPQSTMRSIRRYLSRG